jgi:predicted metalloprotease
VKFNPRARLRTNEVRDTRGRRGGSIARSPVAIGGGGLGIVGVVIYLIVAFAGGGGSSSAITDVLGELGQGSGPATADNAKVAAECRTGADANNKLDCAVVASIDSIQDYWSRELPKLGTQYSAVPTIWFTGRVGTGCGAATSGVGPFYCPGDKRVYIDLSFYQQLRTDFGARGGLFVDAYVLAHEYGHHIQDLLGVESRVKPGVTGPSSGSVRLELQADCYAGVWAHNATRTPGPDGRPVVSQITKDDISRAVDAAKRIGDDYIQTHLGNGTNNPSSYTHGTSAQREKWFSTGYRTGDPKACDTFSTNHLG